MLQHNASKIKGNKLYNSLFYNSNGTHNVRTLL